VCNDDDDVEKSIFVGLNRHRLRRRRKRERKEIN
jgi:hypothetical protein